jgi:hypothetical protein
MERDHIHESPSRNSLGAFWVSLGAWRDSLCRTPAFVGGGASDERGAVGFAYGCGPQIQMELSRLVRVCWCGSSSANSKDED